MLRRALAGTRPGENKRQRFEALLQDRLQSGDDVPPVEDFPLHPAEETPGFLHLSTALQLRMIRTVERWKGDERLTLLRLVVRMFECDTGGEGTGGPGRAGGGRRR